nr:reverse transcriptase domain-containing protein [Tanacetum cinerariifolium]
MADMRTMSELLQAPTEAYRDAIVIPVILAENFELKVGLLSLVTSSQFHGFERDDPHSHIRWFNKITSTLKYKNVPHDAIKLMLFPFSLEGGSRTWLEKEPSRFIHTWEDLVSKFVNYFFPPSKTTNLKNDITNFQQKFKETFSEAWDHFKDLFCKCPHHGFSKLHQINTFYISLTQFDQDSLNADAGGNLLNHMPRDALTIIENKSKVHMVKELVLMNKANQQASVKAVKETCVTCGGPHLYYECLATDSNTLTLLQPRGPTIKEEVERETEATKDKVKITSLESTAHVQPSVVQILIAKAEVARKPKPKLSIPYPLRLNGQKLCEKANNQIFKFLQIFQRLHFDISFSGALLHMLKFASTFKILLSNKEKLFGLASTPLNENCSAVLLKKFHEKLRDPDKFLILCDFPELKECLALADLGASINLMPLFVSKKLSLLELTPTHMTLELVNRSVAILVSVAEDVFVKVGKFYFLADFVVIDYDVDPRVPLILGRPFLRKARALIDIHEDDFKSVVQHQRRVNSNIYKVIKKEVIKLLDARFIYPISDNLWVSLVHCVPKKGGVIVVDNEDNEFIPTRLVTRWRICIDYHKLNDAIRKDHFSLPYMDQMLERLTGNKYYCFLDGFYGYFQILIDPQDQEKTTFTCPCGTFAYQRMPFDLCNAPGTFQRCMMVIFHEMIEEIIEVFLDDFLVFGDYFSSCLSHLDKNAKK